MEKRAVQAIKKKILTFHRRGYLTREKLTELLELLERGRDKESMPDPCELAQAVLSVRFLDELPEKE
ncbi:MAG: hypothetical protein ACLUOI_19010 [Eisenbergiella sp.]